jgi:hypothetical protein
METAKVHAKLSRDGPRKELTIGMLYNKPYRGVCDPTINNPDTTATINQKNKCLSRVGFLNATTIPNSASTAAPDETKGADSKQLYKGAKNAFHACQGEYTKAWNCSFPMTLRMLCFFATHDSKIWNEAIPAARITAPPATAKGLQQPNKGFQCLNRFASWRSSDDR